MDKDNVENKKKVLKFACSECDKSFAFSNSLKNHVKSHSTRKFRLCEDCGKEFRDSFNFKRHVLKMHNSVEKKRESKLLIFSSRSEFLEWKDKMQKETSSKYVQHRAPRVNHDGSIVTQLYCHRSGFYQPCGKGIRQLKLVGSSKISSFCPSKITIKEANGSIFVKFEMTHEGHSADLICSTDKEKETGENDKTLEEITASSPDSSVIMDSIKIHRENRCKSMTFVQLSLSPLVTLYNDKVGETENADKKLEIKTSEQVHDNRRLTPEPLNSETLYFSDKTKFEEWRENMEKETLARYVRKKSARVERNGSYTLHCHRNKLTRSRSKRKCNLKTADSEKTSFCPSRLDVKETDGKFTVVFLKEHLGHDCEKDLLPLRKRSTRNNQARRKQNDETRTEIENQEIPKPEAREETVGSSSPDTGRDVDFEIPNENRCLITELSPFDIPLYNNGMETLELDSLDKKKEDFLEKVKSVLERVDSEEKMQVLFELLSSFETNITNTEIENEVPTFLDISHNNVESESYVKKLRSSLMKNLYRRDGLTGLARSDE